MPSVDTGDHRGADAEPRSEMHQELVTNTFATKIAGEGARLPTMLIWMPSAETSDHRGADAEPRAGDEPGMGCKVDAERVLRPRRVSTMQKSSMPSGCV